MFKDRLKGFTVGVLVTAMLSSTLFVSASTGGVMREVFYGVNIVINGNQWNPPADMTPFIADGRTFLPVRGISEALSVPVTWDGATSTVFLGTQPVGSPFFSTIPHFRDGGTGTNRLTIGNAVSLGNHHANALFSGNAHSTLGAWRDYNLNGQWDTLTGDVLRLDRGGRGSATISFIGDGRELLVVATSENQQPQNISVDVRGVLVLRIEISGNAPNAVALHNAIIQ